MRNEYKLVSALVVAGVAFLLLAMILFGSWFTVDQGERGVVLRNGALLRVAEPGLGFKLPIVDDVVKINVQNSSRLYEELPAYSSDQQTAVLRVSVSYNLPSDQVGQIYSQYGGQEGVLTRLVDREINEVVREVFGKYTAAMAIQKRDQLALDITTATFNAIKGPVNITSVQLENIDFSNAYEDSIEQRMLEEVAVQKMRQTQDRERVTAEISVIQAEAKAKAHIAQAEANAMATRLQGEAEAEAIRARAQALGQNPALVQLTAAERWNGVLPSMMVPGDTVPMLQIPEIAPAAQ